MLVPFVKVAATLTEHRDSIVNAIALGLSNARLEAMNSTVRLISHRSRGFRRLESLLAMIRLVCGKVPVTIPTGVPEEVDFEGLLRKVHLGKEAGFGPASLRLDTGRSAGISSNSSAKFGS